MSFLADEDDQQATLELAFAFIDADCGANAAVSTPGVYSSTDSSSSGDEFWTEREDPASLRVVIRKTPSALLRPSPLLFQHVVTSLTPTMMTPTSSSESEESGATRAAIEAACKRAKAGGGGASRATSLKKHRDRKKAEMQSLRDQVAELETQLAQLRLQRPRLTAAASGAESAEVSLAALPFLLDANNQLRQAAATGTSWVDIARAQAGERFRSEALNAKLRDALQRQLQVSDALRGVLGTGGSQSEELRALLGLQQDQSLHVPAVAPETTLLQQLHANMQQMYMVVESVIGEQSEADWSGAATCTTREKSVGAPTGDSMVGKCIEIRSTAQLFCSFDEVGRDMWRRSTEMNSNAPTGPEKYKTEKRLVSGASFMKTYRIPLESPHFVHPVDLHGTSYMHKFDEETRYVSLWTSMITLPEIGSNFLEQGWMVAAPCLKPSSTVESAASQPTTILKMCYQISCASESSAPSSAQSRALADLVLKTLSRKTWKQLQMMQNTLLDEYSPFLRQSRAL